VNGEALADFYRDAGFRVVSTPSAFWYAQSSQIYRSLPFERAIRPSPEEAREALRRCGALGLEFATDSGFGLSRGTYVLRDPAYGFGSLQRQCRQNVRKGLKLCEARQIDFDELCRLGRPAILATCERQRRRIEPYVVPDAWRRYCDAGRACPQAGAHGCFVGGELAAWLVHFVEDGLCSGIAMMSQTRWRDRGTNHVLYYAFARDMIRRDDVEAVTLGLESLPAAPARDAFKRHLGFRLEPGAIGLILHPWARRILLGPGSARALGLVSRLSGGRLASDRIEGVVSTARATSL
jgi:hypothetical protein